MIPWRDLSPEQQLRLREDYNASPDCLTGTCSLEAKLARFTDWLARRGVHFSEEDLRPPRT
ncbi:hypothetical protein [Actibacterium sp. MT2.3-13A]|uniref:hypothetical protein n=1 Tax=Actibacterium sp. MT2.3-13A TaxID=2828332 RepID=UPI001BA718C5|nr:hypothetical protein [Actibacterium sp. MT2.3-13A]